MGHNPYSNALMDTAITLPTMRPKLLCESICDVEETEPMSRMAALRYAAGKATAGGGSLAVSGGGGAPVGAHLCCAPAQGAAMAAARRAATLMSLSHAEAERSVTASVRGGSLAGSANWPTDRTPGTSLHGGGSGGGGGPSLRRGFLYAAAAERGGSGSVHGRPAASEGSVRSGGGTVRGGAANAPDVRSGVLSALQRPVLDILEAQSAVEEFMENRFLSAERYTAFLVLFHEMAATVATAFPPLAFDTHRSQSALRVATTAAPVSWGRSRACPLSSLFACLGLMGSKR